MNRLSFGRCHRVRGLPDQSGRACACARSAATEQCDLSQPGDAMTLVPMRDTKGACEVLGRDYVEEVIPLADGRQLTYHQVEGSFSNPSASRRAGVHRRSVE